jgi:uncharacterized membrane protein
VGLNWAEHTLEIAAPIELCFDAITDYETFPAWQSAVVETEVTERQKDGRGKRVRFIVDAKIRKVGYTLDYRYDEPTRIEWDFVEGHGINDADGHYLLEELAEGRTRATYKFGLEVGIPLPGPVARRAHRQTLKASVEDLKREAERRAEAAEGARASSPKGLAGFGRRRPPEEPTHERPSTPESGSRPRDWLPADAGSAGGLPGEVAGRALSVGRRTASAAARTGRDIAEGAASAGFGVARQAIRVGTGAVKGVRSRVAGLLGHRSGERGR